MFFQISYFCWGQIPPAHVTVHETIIELPGRIEPSLTIGDALPAVQLQLSLIQPELIKVRQVFQLHLADDGQNFLAGPSKTLKGLAFQIGIEFFGIGDQDFHSLILPHPLFP